LGSIVLVMFHGWIVSKSITSQITKVLQPSMKACAESAITISSELSCVLGSAESTVKRHSGLHTSKLSKESRKWTTSPWIRFCFSKLLWNFTAIYITHLCTRGEDKHGEG
jgi:hypothetical protein